MSEPVSSATKSLANDMKRMVPVWAVIFLTAAGSLLAIRYQGVTFLQKGLYDSSDTCQVAEIHYEAGMKIWTELNREAAEKQLERLSGSSLGHLKGSERLGAARDRFHTALELCPTVLGVNDVLADLAWWNGEADLAHYRLGLAHAERNELDEAQVELRTALEIAEDKSQAAMALAEVSTRQGDWQAAREALELAGDSLENSASGLIAASQLAFHQGNPEEGLNALTRALELDPGHPLGIRYLIAYYEGRNEPRKGADRAMSYLAKAKSPTANSYHLAAINYMYAEDWEDSLAALERALEIAPGAIALHFDRAVVLYRLGRYDAARTAAETAMAKDYRKYQELVSQNRLNPMEKP